jgi:DNA-binding transcriptional MerR regulator
MMQTETALRVGELARRTGVSVRTLHYYDEIGLLSPAHHTMAGYRLYGADEVSRLQQIVSLRQLGFSLDEIRSCLDRRGLSPERVIELHLAHLREQIARQQGLYARLDALAKRMQTTGETSVDAILQTIEEMTRMEKYYTPEQRQQLEERARTVGEARIREVEAEWPKLMEEVRAEMDRGTDPADPHVQELARRWMGLVHEFTGGDPGITQSVKRMWQEETEIHGMETAPMRDMGAYIQRALEAGGSRA